LTRLPHCVMQLSPSTRLLASTSCLIQSGSAKLVQISCQRVLQPQVDNGASASPRVRVTLRHNSLLS
jgi:hypothetical protein